jgi:hypothetical protein
MLSPSVDPPILLGHLACDEVTAQADTLSLLRLRSIISTPALPLQVNLAVVSEWWLRGAGRHLLSARLRDVEGGVLDELGDEVQHEREVIYEHVAQFQVTLPIAGIYAIEILLDGEVIRNSPLIVKQSVEGATA